MTKARPDNTRQLGLVLGVSRPTSSSQERCTALCGLHLPRAVRRTIGLDREDFADQVVSCLKSLSKGGRKQTKNASFWDATTTHKLYNLLRLAACRRVRHRKDET